MITLLIISLLNWILYLCNDAFEDYRAGLDGYHFSHKNNFKVRAASASAHISLILAIGCLTSKEPLLVMAWQALFLAGSWALFMGFFGWLFFDWFFYRISNTRFDHVGSGNIDLWFKKKFGDKAYSKMILAKILGLTLSLILTTTSLIILL